MGLCSSNKVDNSSEEETATPERSNSEVPIPKAFGNKKRTKRDSIAYNKETMAKRASHSVGLEKAPSSMVQVVE